MANKIYVDKAKVIRGKEIVINDFISIYQHSIGEIVDFGEQRFFTTFHTMCSAPWDMPAMLDELGIDFMKITDWEMFVMLRSLFPKESTSMLLGDLDLTSFEPKVRNKEVPIVESEETSEQQEPEQEIILEDLQGHIIDENIYRVLIAYISEIINFQHKNKKPGNRTTAKILIEEDIKERKRNEEKNKPYESFIYDSVISLVNTEELSYDYETIFDLTLYQFTKSLIQIQGKKTAMALLQGSMSGFCDTSNIPKEDMQWMYSDDKYKPRGKKLVNQKIKK